MDYLNFDRNSLVKREYQLKQLIIELEKRNKHRIDGRLYISRINGVNRKYYYKNSDGKGSIKKYLGKKDIELAKRLAQQEYEGVLIKNAVNQLEAIQFILKEFDEDNIFNVFSNLDETRKALIEPLIQDKEDYIEHWKKVEYPAGVFKENMVELFSEKGDRVRSKSEKIIADKYYSQGVPYRYEYPKELWVNGKKVIFKPDFTLLNTRTCEELYHEHLGMMDDPEYCERALRKIEIFEENGLLVGKNLLLTFETQNSPLNMKQIDRIIDNYLV